MNKQTEGKAKNENADEKDTEKEIYITEKVQITVGNKESIEIGVKVKGQNLSILEGKKKRKSVRERN